jgi:RimK family alpha-L-glutamate ligase
MKKVLKFEDFLLESKKTGKKTLFISFTDETRGVSYHDYISSKIDADFCLWADLIFNEGEILFNGNLLSDYGFVFIGVVSKHPDYFVSVGEYLKLHKIPSFNYGCSPERYNKIYQNRVLNSEGLNPVPTIIGMCSEVDQKELVKELGLPIVAKITDGSQGKGVTIQKTEADLKSYLKKNKDQKTIFQKFIENDGDYRLFFVGDKLLYAIERKSTDKKKEFRNNYSLGGKVKRVDLPKEAVDLARKASKAMKFDVAGVDLIKEPQGKKWYILEINSAPQFGVKDGDKIITDYKEVLDEFIGIIKRKMT